KALAERACQHLALSARGFTMILRVARTIADLEQAELFEEHHVAEELQARLPHGPNRTQRAHWRVDSTKKERTTNGQRPHQTRKDETFILPTKYLTVRSID